MSRRSTKPKNVVMTEAQLDTLADALVEKAIQRLAARGLPNAASAAPVAVIEESRSTRIAREAHAERDGQPRIQVGQTTEVPVPSAQRSRAQRSSSKKPVAPTAVDDRGQPGGSAWMGFGTHGR
jgi:hypothetical protein